MEIVFYVFFIINFKITKKNTSQKNSLPFTPFWSVVLCKEKLFTTFFLSNPKTHTKPQAKKNSLLF
ncbi:hypothetical Protein psc5_01040 [Candidatus Phytoplasma solani]